MAGNKTEIPCTVNLEMFDSEKEQNIDPEWCCVAANKGILKPAFILGVMVQQMRKVNNLRKVGEKGRNGGFASGQKWVKSSRY